MNWETLISIGDSITIGARSYAGYPEYAGALLEKQLGNRWNIINHATSGFTTIEICRSVTTAFHDLKQHAPGVVTILAGTNDVKKGTSEDDFRIAYEQLVLKALMISPNTNVILVSIPHFPKGVAYPYTFRMNETVGRFNSIIANIAKRSGLRVLTFNIEEEDLFDGVHLNPQGSRNVGRQLASYIAADKGIVSQKLEEDIQTTLLNV